MSKTSVRGNITVFRDDIEATLAQGFPYILGFVLLLSISSLTRITAHLN